MNKVKTPRWYFRNVQAARQGLLADAATAGGMQAAMVAFLARRADKLPEGKTPESVVGEIMQSINAFKVAHIDGKTAADVKQLLTENVATMSSEQALAYLAALDCAFHTCDHIIGGTGRMPTVEELQAALQRAGEGSPEDIAARIDALATSVEGDSLKAYMYAIGNDDLREMFTADPEHAGEMDETFVGGVRGKIEADVTRAESVAATACATYGMILEGRVPGVTAAETDVGVMTTLVIAGLEKASILSRLARGEIDAELARELMDALVPKIKWLLIKSLHVGGTLLAAGLVLHYLPQVLLWVVLSAWVIPVIALGVALWIGFQGDKVETKIVEFLGRLSAVAGRHVSRGAQTLWQTLKECAAPATATA